MSMASGLTSLSSGLTHAGASKDIIQARLKLSEKLLERVLRSESFVDIVSKLLFRESVGEAGFLFLYELESELALRLIPAASGILLLASKRKRVLRRLSLLKDGGA